MESARQVGGFSGMSSLVVVEGLCPHCIWFPSVCCTEVWPVRLADIWGTRILGNPALFALFVRAGTFPVHHGSRIWEIKIFRSVSTLLAASDKTNPSCFGK